MIKIDKGVPIPQFETKPTKYPWATMEIGDSFAFDADIGLNIHQAGKKYGRKFIRRITPEGGRCWRVS